jgi:methionyl-tRNA formyltransferase
MSTQKIKVDRSYNTSMNLIFFGSFQHYSALILDSLIKHPDINVLAVVTTPPALMGRQKTLTKNPVHLLADSHNIPVFTPEKLDDLILKSLIINRKSHDKVAYFVTAGYGKILPQNWLKYPQYGSLNLHFSLLPKYRGANPAEWAILLGETETGISLIQMNEALDSGDVLAQAAIPIESTETRETLYHKLYTLGAEKLPGWLLKIKNYDLKITPQGPPPTLPARRFTRPQAFLDWRIITAAMTGQPYNPQLLPIYLRLAYDECIKHHTTHFEPSTFIDRTIRALAGFPGAWTIVNTTKGQKRLKLLTSHVTPRTSHLVLDTVQLEGHQPAQFNQIKNQIIER